MHVLVVTVVHHPLDPRIYRRQIRSMVDVGWDVTYAAAWSDRGLTAPDEVAAVDLPRSSGKDRLRSFREARRIVGSHRDVDLVLLHDPELVLVIVGMNDLPPVVWDVHEDTASALTDKSWLPAFARPIVRRAVEAGERWAEDNLHLVLAEPRYRERFRREHPVVPNYPPVPETVPSHVEDRAVYVGRLSRGRGVEELIEVGETLTPDVTLELIGWVDDPEVGARLRAADLAGVVAWGGGFVPNDEALGRVEGAIAGLSLLHDEPNYRHSLPTKILEYLSRGVPVVTTPLPAAVDLVERHECGIVVPFGDPRAVVHAVRRLHADRSLRDAMAERGRRAVLERYSWERIAPDLLDQLAAWAGRT